MLQHPRTYRNWGPFVSPLFFPAAQLEARRESLRTALASSLRPRRDELAQRADAADPRERDAHEAALRRELARAREQVESATARVQSQLTSEGWTYKCLRASKALGVATRGWGGGEVGCVCVCVCEEEKHQRWLLRCHTFRSSIDLKMAW